MDFIRACSTNVHVLQGHNKMVCRSYRPRPDDNGKSSVQLNEELAGALRRFRSVSTLSTHTQGELWVFGAEDEKIREALAGMGCTFEPQHTGTVQELGDGASDLLLNAIESGIQHQLAKTCQTLRLGKRRWLLGDSAQSRECAGATAVRLDVTATSDGALRFATVAEPSKMRPLMAEDADSGVDVVLSPSGRLARISCICEGDEPLGGEEWKKVVCQKLIMDGIAVSEQGPWLRVSLLEAVSGEEFSWPASLCCASRSDTPTMVDDDHDWKRWFTSPVELDGYRNPLFDAGEWPKDALASENAEQKIANSVELAEALPPANHTGLGADLVTSPPFLLRIDQQSAVGIYPTPPDGMILVPSSQQQSSEQVNTAPTCTTDGAAADANISVATVDEHMNAGSEEPQQSRGGRGFSLTSSIGDPGTAQGDHDELFGGMEGMDFGGEEVGDADFSFFDEPDVDPSPLESKAVQDAKMPDRTTSEEYDNGSQRGKENGKSEAKEADGPDEAVTIKDNYDETSTLEAKAIDGSGKFTTAHRSDPVDEKLQLASIKNPGPEKPLSPFSIRERILPPPVPASARQQDPEPPPGSLKRSSSFAHVNFNENYGLPAKYSPPRHWPEINPAADPYTLVINLPLKRMKLPPQRSLDTVVEKVSGTEEGESESEDDSSMTGTSDTEFEMPPTLPWESRRQHESEAQKGIIDISQQVSRSEGALTTSDPLTLHQQERQLLLQLVQGTQIGLPGSMRADQGPSPLPYQAKIKLNITEMFDLTGADLIGIAQLVAEQSVSIFGQAGRDCDVATTLCSDNDRPQWTTWCSTLSALVDEALSSLLPDAACCDLPKLALQRDNPPHRVIAQPVKGQPTRLPHRPDILPPGPEIFPIQAPFVRVQRGDNHWEMLPPALAFWDSLGLAPASGPKDLQVIYVCPSNPDLRTVVGDFLDQLGAVYEGCRLGSYKRKLPDGQESDDGSPCITTVDEGHGGGLVGALKSYYEACKDLGTKLAKLSHVICERTLVIHLINPFRHPQSTPALIACFWALYKAYVEANRANRSRSFSDLVLQILPIEEIADLDKLTVPENQQLSLLARELYDRSPPSKRLEYSSPLGIIAAPAVELATMLPKRIHFQLASEPPHDLMHEGSILHLAYVISPNKEWLSTTWVDSSGRYSHGASFSLRGTNFATVASEVWEWTKEIMAARQVSWRVVIVTNSDVSTSEDQCWRGLIAKARHQMLSVTLLSANVDPTLSILPPPASDAYGKDGLFSQAGFLTPASTPQASNFGVSPDATGQGNAPPTPAPSEPGVNLEVEPDAHLVDSADESWGVLLQRAKPSWQEDKYLAHGALIKRGDTTRPTKMPMLAVSLVWTIQVRPNAIDDWTMKRGEMMLKEVLGMYRNLSVLTKARGLDVNGSRTAVPWHLCAAMRSATALNGYL